MNLREYNGNPDSMVNQKILRELVEANVLANVTDMIPALFNNEDFGLWEEWHNLYVKRCPCGCTQYGINEDGEYYCMDCGEIYEYEDLPEEEEQEIFEYYIVDPWFGRHLKDHGEPVFERYMGWIWGRTTTGQSIYMDSVIAEIAIGMEILEGQERDWSKH